MAGNIMQKYGGMKILWHSDKMQSFREGKITAPLYVRIKPTNVCNHGCFFCSYAADFDYIYSERMKERDVIPREKMMEILDDLKDMGVKAVTYSGGGEPTIYAHIKETLRKTLDNGLDLSIITNGQKLSGEIAELLAKAKWVRISLESIDAETFKIIRKRPESMFNEIIENIRNFAKSKDDSCELGINFVVSKHNWDNVYDGVKFFKDLGVDHVKLTPVFMPKGQFLDYHKDGKDKVIDQIKRARADFEDENFKIYDTYENDFNLGSLHQRTYNKCFVMQTVPIIGADSCVYFCHDKAYTHKGMFGSIKDQSFKELWFSQEVKDKCGSLDPMKECNHHCTYDARNILVNNALVQIGDHINFV